MKISDSAIIKLKTSRVNGDALRISVVGGGCSGMSYKMQWIKSEEILATDALAEKDDLVLVIDRKSMLYLSDVTLDYSEDLNNYGFKWSNLNAKRTCGCGESFST